MRKSVVLYQNDDGTWTGEILWTRFVGTYNEVVAWLRGHQEEPPLPTIAPRGDTESLLKVKRILEEQE